MTTQFARAVAELNTLGIVLRQAPGEYRVNHRHGHPEMDYRTDDLEDAVERGKLMGLLAQKLKPPLGPIGPRRVGKSKMYRHNTKLAARRRRAENSEEGTA